MSSMGAVTDISCSYKAIHIKSVTKNWCNIHTYERNICPSLTFIELVAPAALQS